MAWQGRILVYRREGENWWLRFLGEEGEIVPGAELPPGMLEALQADMRHQRHKLGHDE